MQYLGLFTVVTQSAILNEHKKKETKNRLQAQSLTFMLLLMLVRGLYSLSL